MAEEEDTRNKVELGTGNGTIDDQASGEQKPKPNPVERVVSVRRLAANRPGLGAPNIIPSLANAWGMVPFNETFWIAGNRTGDVPIVDGRGVASTGPVASGAIHLEPGITGVAATGAADTDTMFQIHRQTDCRAAQLLFSSEEGRIFATNTNLSTTKGFVVIDRSTAGANYKGLAVLSAQSGSHGRTSPLILAADFHNARIDVFDENFKLVSNVSFDISKSLPAGFAPFNVATFDDMVVVAFAKQDAKKEDAVAGRGLGFVATFDVTGKLLALAKGSELNAPWGMAVSCNFGPARNALLVGNFGDGHITVFDLRTMTSRGQLETQRGKPVAIEGLWDLNFGADVRNARPNELFFTAGPNDEKDGLFGVITAASEK